MNILDRASGKFQFLTNKYELVEYDNFWDIPEDLSDMKELICFLPDVPPPPHSVQEHELMKKWNGELKKIMDKIYASRNKNR